MIGAPGRPGAALVWGNCQADPVARLLTVPLRDMGIQVWRVPPVYLLDEGQVAQIRRVVRRCALLVTQPVRDDYRVSGCGSEQMAELVPASASVVTMPIVYDQGPFPYQVNAHGGDGDRVNAPITDYHDLRVVAAAAHGHSTVDLTPDRASIGAVAALAAESAAEQARREHRLDVHVGRDVRQPDALHTMTHPANTVLVSMARGVLAALGCGDASVQSPDEELLGERRAPVDPVAAAALGWPAPTRTTWTIGGLPVSDHDVTQAHLSFYRQRPDVVADTVERQADRIAALRLLD